MSALHPLGELQGSAHVAARVAMVRPARRERSPAMLWPMAPAVPTARAQPGGMPVAAPSVAVAKAPVVADRAPVTGP